METIVQIAITAALAGLSWLFIWLARRSWATAMEQDLFGALNDFTQRVKDKVAVAMAEAMDPSSPGGARITSEERSALRQLVYNMAIAELPMPVLKYAKGKGEAWIKGKIGGILDKKLDESADVADALAAPVESATAKAAA